MAKREARKQKGNGPLQQVLKKCLLGEQQLI